MKKFLFYSFLLFSSFQYRLKKRLTTPGIFVSSGLLISAMIGIDTTLTMLFQVFMFSASLFLVATIYSLFFRARFSVERILPDFGTVGVPIRYRLIVQNETKKMHRGLSLLEDLEDPRPTFDEFANSHEPDEENRNWFDRKVGFYRWQWLISKKTGGIVKACQMPDIPPKSSAEFEHEIFPVQRGLLMFNGVTIARPDPFGLIRSFVKVPKKQSTWVLPRRYPVPPIRLPGSRQFQQGGVALASSVGDSEEFLSLRDYRPGDPLRRLHWKSWAKTGKPTVMEYQAEFFVRHALILDTFLSEAYSERFEEAVSVAASLVCTLETMESLLDLLFVGIQSYCFTSGRGLASTNKMLEILSSVKLCKDKPFDELRHSVLKQAPLLSGCICIFLLWDEKRRDLIAELRKLGLPLMVLVITDSRLDSTVDHPGPMKDQPGFFHVLEVGKIQEGLAKI